MIFGSEVRHEQPHPAKMHLAQSDRLDDRWQAPPGAGYHVLFGSTLRMTSVRTLPSA